MELDEGQYDDLNLPMLEDIASNCSLRLEHIQALNISNMSVLMRLYNMCEHTWDPDKTWDVYYWEELLPPLFIYSLTLSLGVVGNLLIIWAILGYRKMQTPTNIFLASLAMADLLLCVICIPVKLAELFSFSWTFGLFLCKFVNYMQNVSAIASVINLTVMSLERCYAIVYPMKAKSVCTVSRANKAVCMIWLLAIVLAIPTLIVQIHLEVGLVQKAFWCIRDDQTPYVWQAHELYYLLIILIIPGSLMTAAYGAIAREICRCMKERAYFVASHKETSVYQSDGQGLLRTGSRPNVVLDYDTSEDSPKILDETMATTDSRRESPGSVSFMAAAQGYKSRQVHRKSVKAEPCSTELSDDTKSLSRNSSRRTIAHNPDLDDKPATFKMKRSLTFEDQSAKNPSLSVTQGDEENRRERKRSNSNEAWIPITSGYKVQKQSLKKFRRVIKMLVVIIVVYIVCWTPYLLINIFQAFGLINSQLQGSMKYIKTTLTLMAYLNSALNPIIYGFMARSFRENFLKSMRSCLGLRVVQDQPILKTQNNLELQEVSHVNGLRVNRSRGNTLHSSIPQKGLDLRLNQRKSKVKRGSSKRSSNNYSTSLSLSGTNPDHQGFSPGPDSSPFI